MILWGIKYIISKVKATPMYVILQSSWSCWAFPKLAKIEMYCTAHKWADLALIVSVPGPEISYALCSIFKVACIH